MTRRKRMSYNTMVRKERERKKQWREERSRIQVSESDSDDHDEVPLSQLKVKLSEDEVDTQEQLKDLDTDTDDEVPLVQTKIKLRPDDTETKEDTQKNSSDQQLKDLEIRLSPISFEETNKLTKTEDQNPSQIDCDDSDTDSIEELPIIQTKNKLKQTDTEMQEQSSTSEQQQEQQRPSDQHLKHLEIRLSPICTEQQIINTEHKDKDTSPQNSDDSTAGQQQTAPNHQLKDLEIRLSPMRTEELDRQTEAKDKDEKSCQPITKTDDSDSDTLDEFPLSQTKTKLEQNNTETQKQTQNARSDKKQSDSVKYDNMLKDLEIRISPISTEEQNRWTKIKEIDKNTSGQKSDESDSDRPNEVLSNQTKVKCKQTDKQQLTQDSDSDTLDEFPLSQSKTKLEQNNTETQEQTQNARSDKKQSDSVKYDNMLKDLEIRISPISTEEQNRWTKIKEIDKNTSGQKSDESDSDRPNEVLSNQTKVKCKQTDKQQLTQDSDSDTLDEFPLSQSKTKLEQNNTETQEQTQNARSDKKQSDSAKYDNMLKDLEIKISPISTEEQIRWTKIKEIDKNTSGQKSDESDSDNPNEVPSNQTKVKCKQTDKQELTQNTKAVDPPLKDLEIRLAPISIEKQNRWAQAKQGNITSSPYSCENSEQKQSESTQHLKQHLKQLQIRLSPLSIEEQIRWTKVKEEKIDSSQQSSDKQMSVNCLKDLEIRLFPLSIEEQIRWTKVKEEKIDSSQLSCNPSESVNCLKDLEIRLCPLSVEEQIRWTKVKEEKKDNYEKSRNSQQRSLKDLEIRLSPLSIEDQIRWTKVEKEKINSSQIICDDSDSDDCDEVPLSQLKKKSYKKQKCGLMEPMKMLKIKLFPIDTEEHKKWMKIKEVNKMSRQHNCDNLPSDRQFSKFQLKDLEIQLSPIDLDNLDTYKSIQKFGFGSRKRPIVVEDEDDLSPSCCDNNKVPRLLDNQQKLSDDIVSVPDLVLCSDTHKNSNMDSTRSTRSGKKRRIAKRNDSQHLLPDRPLTPMFDDSDQDEDFSDIVLDIPNLF